MCLDVAVVRERVSQSRAVSRANCLVRFRMAICLASGPSAFCIQHDIVQPPLACHQTNASHLNKTQSFNSTFSNY